MKLSSRVLIVLALGAIIAVANTGVALADGGQDEGIVRPDLGPEVEGPTPGVDGYKVFGPNAIITQSIGGEKESGIRRDLLRTGTTDIWQEGSNGTLHGSHTSESDINEDVINVDGAIKEVGQGWFDSDRDHASGYFANCNTQMSDRNFWQTFHAHSWHFWHTEGYYDFDGETYDEMET